ncbi:MAG: hypothetical protein IID38_01235 [Planctomycetes bacterium]|nr:hypothetical protein [Planctomycetota bacterium]
MTLATGFGLRASGAIQAPDFLSIIHTYNEVTERLKQSHEVLGREVCRLREELHDKNRQLHRRERLAALGEMAAGVAHEIRNPLGAIQLYASLLQRDLADRPPRESEAQLKLVQGICAGARNLENIVEDILAYAGEMQPNPRAVRLAEILEIVLGQVQPKGTTLADGAGMAEPRAALSWTRATIEIDDAVKDVTLYCDARQIGRALLNLIGNALDAAGERGQVWVRCGLRGAGASSRGAADGVCDICVEDNGPGIEPALLQRVFHPFFTTKDGGTGLGLAIVHRIAEANGGFVRAGNRKGGGTTFVLSVPVADTAASKVEGRSL